MILFASQAVADNNVSWNTQILGRYVCVGLNIVTNGTFQASFLSQLEAAQGCVVQDVDERKGKRSEMWWARLSWGESQSQRIICTLT